MCVPKEQDERTMPGPPNLGTPDASEPRAWPMGPSSVKWNRIILSMQCLKWEFLESVATSDSLLGVGRI